MMLAMGNKCYDGIIFRIPQVCLWGSFMGKCAEDAGVGISLDVKKGLPMKFMTINLTLIK